MLPRRRQGGEGVPAHHKYGVQYPQVCDESLFSSLVAWEGLRLEIKKNKKICEDSHYVHNAT